MRKWGKPTDVAEYAGVGIRTVRKWLRSGLKHSRLPTGRILINFDAVDEFLEQYSCDCSQADEIVQEVCRELGF